jgi:4-amino-4-deoxy-L-arabinose transferase-like glycosyltransferase
MRVLSYIELKAPLHGLAFALALALYLAATLPHLGDFPLIGQDEPWIAAPAAKLATQGVYGDDLFAGYYNMEQRTYNFPPLFPLTEALAFRLLGVGAWQARLVAVLYGAATLGLTYALGWRLYCGALGALAAWMLVGLRLALEPSASGVPLLDLARIARYDIAVPPLALATLLCFVAAEAADERRTTNDERPATTDQRLTTRQQTGRPSENETGDYGLRTTDRRDASQFSILHSQFFMQWRYFATGLLAGLACLAHVYGGLVLAPIGALLLWRDRLRALRRPAPYAIAAGFALALLPWGIYIAQDLPAYFGQMLPEQTRFRLWEPAFYLDSLLREPSRYSRLLRINGVTVLWPRLGIWVALLGLPLSIAMLLLRISGRSLGRASGPPQNPTRQIADRLLLLALPLFALLLALLVNLKFYNYITLLLPCIALNLALLGVCLWRAAAALSSRGRAAARAALGGLLALVLLDGLVGVRRSLVSAAAISPYDRYTERVAAAIPPGARVLALHQFWFGLYPRGYIYRSVALAYYYSDPRYYTPAPLPIEEALARIAPEYILVDRAMARELRMDLPAEALDDERDQRFRRYLARHCAHPVARIADSHYGDLTIYRLCPEQQGMVPR